VYYVVIPTNKLDLYIPRKPPFVRIGVIPKHGKQIQHQKVLASFLGTIAKDGGWWYRVPKGIVRSEKEPSIPQDAIIPHIGTIFWLTEEATQNILHEMGLLCCKNTKNNTYCICIQGWEDLCALFKVDDLLELKVTRFKKEFTYVRLGIVPEHAL
jgi:hypothetical protein